MYWFRISYIGSQKIIHIIVLYITESCLWHLYIYIYIEREREPGDAYVWYIYIYILIYIYRRQLPWQLAIATNVICDLYQSNLVVSHLMLKYSLQSYITLTSHERHSILNHRQFDCLFNSLFRLKTKKTWTLIASRLEGNPLMTGGSPNKRSIMVKVFLCHVVIIILLGAGYEVSLSLSYQVKIVLK